MSNMETSDSGNSKKLLACIDELRKQNCSNLATICDTMLAKHNVNSEITKSLLETLKNDGKLFTVEQKGVVVFMSIPLTVGDSGLKDGQKASNSSNNSKSMVMVKELSLLLGKCLKEINQSNNNPGVSFDEISNWLKTNSESRRITGPEELQKVLDREVSFSKLKRSEAGLYLLAKKRGRPSGTGSTSSSGRRNSKTPTTVTPVAVKKSPDEATKRVSQLGKRKRIKKSHDDFEFYDTPGNKSIQTLPPVTDPICDFCLKTSSSNRQGLFEELLMCKDCPAKAHASCMAYSEILSRRARIGPWQCIDCKTCCLCLDSGDPDDLLFCDACDKGYHMFCHDPAIKEKPKNKWACRACMDDGVSHDDLLNTSSSPVEDTTNGATTPQELVFTEPTSSPDQESKVSVGPVEEPSPVSGVVSPSTNQTPSPPSPKRFLPPIPGQWNVEHVSQYIRENGFPVEAKRFSDQEIDGKSLMLLMRQDVLCNLGLKLGPALKIYENIRILQKSPSNRAQAAQ